MHPDPHRANDPLEEAHRRRRIILVVAALVTGAIAVGVGMMALVVAFVPGGFVDSSFVNETEEDLVIYVNGEAQAVAGGGATVSNFALFPSEAAEAAPRYVVQAYTLDFEQEGCTAGGGCEDELRHCAVYTWAELADLDWKAPITANAAPGLEFGDVPRDTCP